MVAEVVLSVYLMAGRLLYARSSGKSTHGPLLLVVGFLLGHKIQVSTTKKPLFFYVNLAKRFLQEHGEVQLSALGLAISSMVTVAEILKSGQWAVETKITTGLDTQEGEGRDRPMQKAKMEIILTKSPQFDELMAGTTPQQAGQQAQRQQQTPGVGSGSGARGGPSQPSSSEDAAAGGAEPSEPGPSSQPQGATQAAAQDMQRLSLE